MKYRIPCICVCVALSVWALGQTSALRFPETVEAGTTLSVPTSGSGSATLYVVGPGGAFRKQIELGRSFSLGTDDLKAAGHYVVFLTTSSGTENAELRVVPSAQPANVSFLAKPSRLAVNLSDAVSGVAYVFDIFGNLVVKPQQVSFELSDSAGRAQSRVATSREGVAWVRMNSAAKAGSAQFQAIAGNIREKRVIQQVPGDPCSLKMSARPAASRASVRGQNTAMAQNQGPRVALETEPVRDCNGNPVPDGTIVTFTETYAGGQSTVDVPLKRGVARTELPVRKGAVISVASGVVMGNEIRWSGGL